MKTHTSTLFVVILLIISLLALSCTSLGSKSDQKSELMENNEFSLENDAEELKDGQAAVYIEYVDEKPANKFVGMWHASPGVGSGYSDSYLFYSNGSFTFHRNSMECDNPELSFSGTYEIVNKTLIVLSVKQKKHIEGGTLQPTNGSCATEYEIVGGEIVEKELNETYQIDLKLSDYYIDKEYYDMHTYKFNSNRYWRMSTNPEMYYW